MPVLEDCALDEREEDVSCVVLLLRGEVLLRSVVVTLVDVLTVVRVVPLLFTRDSMEVVGVDGCVAGAEGRVVVLTVVV